MTAGPLTGVTVIEVASEYGSFAGKLMADMGAAVVLVEQPGADGLTPERQLLRWHYHTSKRGVTLNREAAAGGALFDRLVRQADVLLACPVAGAAPGLAPDSDWHELLQRNPRLIVVTITPFGLADPRTNQAFTDLTILAGGGPVWMCGYDDHALPPVRGGGNQGYHTACHFAVMSTLVALLSRERSGRGQHIDVNMHACANVTTEAGTYTWLGMRETVQRQTGRHASVHGTQPTQIRCADGRYVVSGVPPRTAAQFRSVLDWLHELGIAEEFDQTPILELAIEETGGLKLDRVASDDNVRARLGAGRDALNFIAERTPAMDFFQGAQQRGFQVSIVYSPEEAFEDEHLKARGFQVEVEHPELGKTFLYPGAPIRFTRTPWQIRRRAPLLGEDNAEVFAELGLTEADLAKLRAEGVI
ncbi:MAG TPA: CaiB/BaiF CoA-transferase family protein [Dehalococcoidia bacterium]|nr:CaiB/BaiF CoA-transferase family protein [Dehalococcoidia bacterium]